MASRARVGSVLREDQVAQVRLSNLSPGELWLWSVGGVSDTANLREFVLALRDDRAKPRVVLHGQVRRVDGRPVDAFVLPSRRVDALRHRAFMRAPEVKATRALLQSVDVEIDGRDPGFGVLSDKLMACGHWLGEPLALWLSGDRKIRREARAKFYECAPEIAVFRGWRERERRYEQGQGREFIEAMQWLSESSASGTITRLPNGAVSIMIGNDERMVYPTTQADREFFHASPRVISGRCVEWIGSNTALVRPGPARD